MTPERFTLVKRGGRLELTAPAKYRRFVDRVREGAEVGMVLGTAKKQGTQSMRYYRGVVIPDIAEACGYEDPDEFEQVHEHYAWKFLRIADHPQFGYPRRRSTAKNDLSQEEMTAYIDKVIRDAETTIVGCHVRRPEDVADWDHVPDYQYAEDAA